MRNPRTVIERVPVMCHDPAGIASFVRLHNVAFAVPGIGDRQPFGRVHLRHLFHRERENRLGTLLLASASGTSVMATSQAHPGRTVPVACGRFAQQRRGVRPAEDDGADMDQEAACCLRTDERKNSIGIRRPHLDRHGGSFLQEGGWVTSNRL